MRHYVITGASRGLGLELAREASDSQITCIARHETPALRELGKTAAEYRFVALDLAHGGQVAAMAAQLFSSLAQENLSGIYLINNAAIVSPLAPSGEYCSRQAELAVQINLLAPMELTGAFIRYLGHAPCDKRILNISSGAGRKPTAGWSVYGASKAGLDHFTRCVGLEQRDISNGVRIASIAPGVVDTDMQAELRGASPQLFPRQAEFVDLYDRGGLVSPRQAASALLAWLHSDRFGFGDISRLDEV